MKSPKELQRKFISSVSVVRKPQTPSLLTLHPLVEGKCFSDTQQYFPILVSEQLQTFSIQIITGHKRMKKYSSYTAQLFKLNPTLRQSHCI